MDNERLSGFFSQETLPGKGDSEARYKRAIKEAADSIREEMEDQK